MAHFAEISPENEVLRILVLDNETLLDDSGIEHESRGVDYLTWLLGGTWVQTSYNSSIRGRFAAPGMLYRADLDLFIHRQPFPSWTLDSTGTWQPPTPMPDDGATYSWEEETQSWVAHQEE
ncbi:hypothetical protein [Sagittula sp.]|uniref:hypothetical protein n=1 Tax=Sagittula sp. TaxID=2038081 RepID=UPI003511CE5A